MKGSENKDGGYTDYILEVILKGRKEEGVLSLRSEGRRRRKRFKTGEERKREILLMEGREGKMERKRGRWRKERGDRVRSGRM